MSTQNSTQKATSNVTQISATFFVAMNMTNETILADMWRKFGHKVRERRDELGLTQAGAGKRADMKRQQWNRIEQGASTKRPTLLRIAKALELDPAIVFDWAGFKVEPDGCGQSQAVTVEEILDSALFFDRKGLSEGDREMVRPLLKGADDMINFLVSRKPIIDITELEGRPEAERIKDSELAPNPQDAGH